MSTALLTDHYELTMLQAALADGRAGRNSVFEVFARRLPAGRRFGLVAGTARILQALEEFRFGDDELAYLSDNAVVDDATLAWLADYRFSGTITGYREGEAYFPGSPVLTVEGTFAECVLLETLILSILNHDSAIASAAARMTIAAGERPCIEMGSRRTHEEAAVASARASYLAGFASSSNLEAGRRYGVPTAGTTAHAFILLHDTEREAFESQVASLGVDTTLLVDTYDVPAAVRTALEVTGGRLGALRLDSGDLLPLAHTVRRQLDDLGATETSIVVTGDLDEYSIAGLSAAPADAYGVGTSLVTGSGAPTSSMVYKLVAREDAGGSMRPVAKQSAGKPSIGGRKRAHRVFDDAGVAVAEVVGAGPAPGETAGRALQVAFVDHGERVDRTTLSESRDHCAASIAELPPAGRRLSDGDPAIPTHHQPGGSMGRNDPQEES